VIFRWWKATCQRSGQVKCDYVVQELGFDACVDYKAGDLAEALASAAPQGIDIYFDNVGGEILDTVLEQLNAFARIPVLATWDIRSGNRRPGLVHSFLPIPSLTKEYQDSQADAQ
jgi:NADPH:quinone reductase-like Zn-dependent oxidoreductase